MKVKSDWKILLEHFYKSKAHVVNRAEYLLAVIHEQTNPDLVPGFRPGLLLATNILNIYAGENLNYGRHFRAANERHFALCTAVTDLIRLICSVRRQGNIQLLTV